MGTQYATQHSGTAPTHCSVRKFQSLDGVESRLLDDWQRDFPLIARPFGKIAENVGISEERVLELLAAFELDGTVSRVGPVFRPNRIGVSTLVAVAVKGEAELLDVAAVINQFEAVNHNYEREDTYNLWFVATARDAAELNDVLDTIERRVDRVLLRLPLIRDYHIDLGFSMRAMNDASTRTRGLASTEHSTEQGIDQDALQSVIHAVQSGLPLVPRPYHAIGERIGWSEDRVIDCLSLMLKQGIIKRLGVVVRHHELGFSANAMVVWDIPDALVDATGESLGKDSRVTLCYRRPRVAGRWPYNLFSMVHGQDRNEVLQQVERLAMSCGSAARSHKVLFSGRRFKQRGARYFSSPVSQSDPVAEERKNG